MKKFIIILLLVFPYSAHADNITLQGVASLKACIMQNDKSFCHNVITPDSYQLFDKFFAYKLSPCLPSDLTFDSESGDDREKVVKIRTPAGGGKDYIVRMAFSIQNGVAKFNIPKTLRIGLGEKWQERLNMSEQLYLMMKQNMGDSLNCDLLTQLVKANRK